MHKSVKEKLIAQKLKSGQQLTDEELAFYAIMNRKQLVLDFDPPPQDDQRPG